MLFCVFRNRRGLYVVTNISCFGGGDPDDSYVTPILGLSKHYTVAHLRELCFEERAQIRMDLQWLHESLEVAAMREMHGLLLTSFCLSTCRPLL